jgi:hypothetical protein
MLDFFERKNMLRVPGGFKRSVYSRELGVYGIREIINIKTAWIGPARVSDASR